MTSYRCCGYRLKCRRERRCSLQLLSKEGSRVFVFKLPFVCQDLDCFLLSRIVVRRGNRDGISVYTIDLDDVMYDTGVPMFLLFFSSLIISVTETVVTR